MSYAWTRLVGFLLLLAPLPVSAQPSPAQPMVVTLLGTAGGPPPHPDRAQPASLVQVGGRSYLVDAGENVAQQALRAGVPPNRLDAVFITHMHWDHTLGLGYLMATGWMMNRTVPLPLWGPPGLGEFVRRQVSAVGVGEDIFRPQAAARPALGSLYPVNEVRLTGTREIYRDADVRVTAAITSHFDVVHAGAHSYGRDVGYAYRFDTARGSVTFTGDTGPSEAVTALARGSDVLVAEIVDLHSIGRALTASSGGANIERLMTHMRQQHLTPEALGRMATAAGVRKLVLNHYVMGHRANPEQLAEQIRPFFSGEIVVGRDLMTIEIAR